MRSEATPLPGRALKAYERASQAFLEAFCDDTLDLDDKRVLVRYATLNLNFARANYEHACRPKSKRRWTM